MEYVIAIEETVVQEFKVIAENAKEALIQAQKKYKSGKLVLDHGEVQFKQIAITTPDKEATEWQEF